MLEESHTPEPPVRDLTRSDCADYLLQRCKPAEHFRIGLEQEFFCYDLQTLKPLSFDGEFGIESLLSDLAHRSRLTQDVGSTRFEADRVIAVEFSSGRSLTLEPGCQLELSEAPVSNIHEMMSNLRNHLRQILSLSGTYNMGLLPMGQAPFWTPDDPPVLPKERYRIMRRHIRAHSQRAVEMMPLTCTTQISLDFSSQEDMVSKMRVGCALQPLITALFANSPFRFGRLNGTLSNRAESWRHFDLHNSGLWPFVFEPSMGFQRYADFVMDHVRMYFIKDNDRIQDIYPRTFQDLMQGRVLSLQDKTASLSRWKEALSFSFPEVRLRNVLEMRGADSGNMKDTAALGALWVGLLYDETSLQDATEMISALPLDTILDLHRLVPGHGLRAVAGKTKIADLATQALAIATQGLKRRNRINSARQTEEIYLEPLRHRIEEGQSPADLVIAEWNSNTQTTKNGFMTSQALSSNDVMRR